MGVWDEYCLICGGPPGGIDLDDLAQQVLEGCNDSPLGTADPRAVAHALERLDAEMDWATHWVGIASDERRWVLSEYTAGGTFRLQEGDQEFRLEGPARSTHASLNAWLVRTGKRSLGDLPPNNGPSGVAFHRSCEAVLDADLGYRLTHRELIHRLRDGSNRDGNLVEGIDYGPIVTCFDQYFDYVKAIVDGIDWMLRDPLVHSRNRKRIIEMWRSLSRLLA
jgi:hypothetical protein